MNWKSEYSPAKKKGDVSKTRKYITAKICDYRVSKAIERHVKMVVMEVVMMVMMILMMMMEMKHTAGADQCALVHRVQPLDVLVTCQATV
jgi:uncharacterized membrane protein YbaN (DUF454 family)